MTKANILNSEQLHCTLNVKCDGTVALIIVRIRFNTAAIYMYMQCQFMGA